jgi:hypothetical protein
MTQAKRIATAVAVQTGTMIASAMVLVAVAESVQMWLCLRDDKRAGRLH